MTGIERLSEKEPIKEITPKNKFGLEDLDFYPGELIGFDNSDLELPQPFLLARIGNSGYLKRSNRKVAEMLKGSNFEPFTKALLLISADNTSDAYLLNVTGKVRELWNPHYDEHNAKPNIQKVNPGRYVFDSAYAGRENVIKALRERADVGLDLYADLLESRWGRMTIWGR